MVRLFHSVFFFLLFVSLHFSERLVDVYVLTHSLKPTSFQHAYAFISSDRSLFIDYHVASSDPCHDRQFDYLLSMVDRRSMHHLQMSARRANKVYTICLNFNPRPLMQGDEEFGMDEHGKMLRAQNVDPKWDQGGDEGSKQSASTD